MRPLDDEAKKAITITTVLMLALFLMAVLVFGCTVKGRYSIDLAGTTISWGADTEEPHEAKFDEPITEAIADVIAGWDETETTETESVTTEEVIPDEEQETSGSTDGGVVGGPGGGSG
jgi:hypothetical protein